MVNQTDLKNKLQTLWQELNANPRNRALAVANALVNHGDAETIAMFTRLIEQQTPDSDERETALKLLACLPKPQAEIPAPPPSIRDQLMALWNELGGNPRNRALVVARMVSRLGDRALADHFKAMINHHTPVSSEKAQALGLIRSISHIHIDHGQSRSAAPYLPTDPELARMCVLLHCAAEFRLWIILQHLTNEDEGNGIISKKTFKEALPTYDVHYTPRHLNRLLKQGEGLFWYIAENKNIYLRGWIKVGLDITRKAEASGVDINTNKPGARRSFINVSGSLERWEASIYAGWICFREGVTIARETLSRLFGRDANTIRRWETARLGKEISRYFNYVQCGDLERYSRVIPNYHVPYVARVYYEKKVCKVVRVRWQLPNTYYSSTLSMNRKGQARKVRRAVNAEYPPVSKPGGQCLRYLKSPKAMKRLYKNLKFRMGLLGDTKRPFYVYMGQHRRTGHGIYEICNTGYLFTYANERLDGFYERQYFKALSYYQAKALYTVSREKGDQNGTLISPTQSAQ